MITVTNLKKSLNSTPVLRDISFQLNDGEMVGLVGPSGGGKSVLLKVLGGILAPDSGSVECSTKNFEPTSGHDHEGEEVSVGFLFQEGALFDSMNVLDNVAFPLRVCHDASSSSKYRFPTLDRKQAYERAYGILHEIGLAKAWKKFPGQLSGGMRRRVGLARALVGRARVVLLDDPTGGLDPVAASVIVNLVQRFHRDYHPTIIMVSHDIRRLLPNVERVIALFQGEIVFYDRPEELLTKAGQEVLEFLTKRFDFQKL